MKPANNNHTDKVMYLSKGHYGDKRTWHYVLVDKIKLPILMMDAKRGVVDIARYGQIVFSGFGAEPPAEVVRVVKKKYG
jgi:hypothetical protein